MITIALLFLAINVLVEGRSASGQGSVIVIYVRDAGFIPQSEFRGFMGDTIQFHFGSLRPSHIVETQSENDNSACATCFEFMYPGGNLGSIVGFYRDGAPLDEPGVIWFHDRQSGESISFAVDPFRTSTTSATFPFPLTTTTMTTTPPPVISAPTLIAVETTSTTTTTTTTTYVEPEPITTTPEEITTTTAATTTATTLGSGLTLPHVPDQTTSLSADTPLAVSTPVLVDINADDPLDRTIDVPLVAGLAGGLGALAIVLILIVVVLIRHSKSSRRNVNQESNTTPGEIVSGTVSRVHDPQFDLASDRNPQPQPGQSDKSMYDSIPRSQPYAVGDFET